MPTANPPLPASAKPAATRHLRLTARHLPRFFAHWNPPKCTRVQLPFGKRDPAAVHPSAAAHHRAHPCLKPSRRAGRNRIALTRARRAPIAVPTIRKGIESSQSSGQNNRSRSASGQQRAKRMAHNRSERMNFILAVVDSRLKNTAPAGKSQIKSARHQPAGPSARHTAPSPNPCSTARS